MFMILNDEDESEEYDQSITVFSPEGRLLQVEYAFEAVNRGATIIGITCQGGVVLGAEELEEELQDPAFNRKIFEVEEHIGAAVVGLSSDANVLVAQARRYAQTVRLTYSEPIDIDVLAKRIGDMKQLYTQYAWVRPFGVSIIFGGIDKNGTKLFVTDPSGSYRAYKAIAIGIGNENIEEILKNKYVENSRLDDAVKLAVECLVASLKARGEKLGIKIAVIPSETRKFKILAHEEIAAYIQ